MATIAERLQLQAAQIAEMSSELKDVSFTQSWILTPATMVEGKVVDSIVQCGTHDLFGEPTPAYVKLGTKIVLNSAMLSLRYKGSFDNSTPATPKIHNFQCTILLPGARLGYIEDGVWMDHKVYADDGTVGEQARSITPVVSASRQGQLGSGTELDVAQIGISQEEHPSSLLAFLVAKGWGSTVRKTELLTPLKPASEGGVNRTQTLWSLGPNGSPGLNLVRAVLAPNTSDDPERPQVLTFHQAWMEHFEQLMAQHQANQAVLTRFSNSWTGTRFNPADASNPVTQTQCLVHAFDVDAMVRFDPATGARTEVAPARSFQLGRRGAGASDVAAAPVATTAPSVKEF